MQGDLTFAGLSRPMASPSPSPPLLSGMTANGLGAGGHGDSPSASKAGGCWELAPTHDAGHPQCTRGHSLRRGTGSS